MKENEFHDFQWFKKYVGVQNLKKINNFLIIFF